MPLELAKKPDIDETRAGTLHIDPHVIGDLLGLPPSMAVYGARIDDLGSIELLIRGEDMPPAGALKPGNVILLMHQERRESGEYRVTASWEHLPEKTWIIRDWHRRGEI